MSSFKKIGKEKIELEVEIHGTFKFDDENNKQCVIRMLSTSGDECLEALAGELAD